MVRGCRWLVGTADFGPVHERVRESVVSAVCIEMYLSMAAMYGVPAQLAEAWHRILRSCSCHL